MFDRTRDWADIEEMLLAETLDARAMREQLLSLVGPADPRVAKLDATLRRLGRSDPRAPRQPGQVLPS